MWRTISISFYVWRYAHKKACLSMFMHACMLSVSCCWSVYEKFLWLCNSYVGWEPVGRRGLVDVIVVVLCVGATLCGLPLASPHWATLHHATPHLCWGLLRRLVWVTVICHNSLIKKRSSFQPFVYIRVRLFSAWHARFSPTTPEVPPGSVYSASCAASLVACVTGDKILGRQLRSHVTHGLNGDSVWCHSWWKDAKTKHCACSCLSFFAHYNIQYICLPFRVSSPQNPPAVEKAHEAAQLPWSSGSWIFPGHFSSELKWSGRWSFWGSMFICKSRIKQYLTHGVSCLFVWFCNLRFKGCTGMNSYVKC